MIVYNETVIVDEAVHTQWLKWMQQDYIPQVMATGHFNRFNILTVLDSPNEGVTYCIQYFADNRDEYNKFQQEHLQGLHTLHYQKFENQFVMFNTLMKAVQ